MAPPITDRAQGSGGILNRAKWEDELHIPNLERAFRIAASSFGKRFTSVAMRYLAIPRQWRGRDVVNVAYRV